MRQRLGRLDAFTKALIQAAYPGYRGRKVYLDVSDRPFRVWSGWDGGSRDEFVAVDLATMRTAEQNPACANPFRSESRAEYTPQAGIVVVEHSVFCGKDSGITLHVHPENAARLLSA